VLKYVSSSNILFISDDRVTSVMRGEGCLYSVIIIIFPRYRVMFVLESKKMNHVVCTHQTVASDLNLKMYTLNISYQVTTKKQKKGKYQNKINHTVVCLYINTSSHTQLSKL